MRTASLSSLRRPIILFCSLLSLDYYRRDQFIRILFAAFVCSSVSLPLRRSDAHFVFLFYAFNCRDRQQLGKCVLGEQKGESGEEKCVCAVREHMGNRLPMEIARRGKESERRSRIVFTSLVNERLFSSLFGL